jgi:agmatinase
MSLPFEYDQIAVGEFGGSTPTSTNFDKARVVILPIPLDRTTSYVPGTRNGPHEILVASSHMELWDEETQTNVHSIGVYTLPEMDFPFASMDEVVREIRRVAAEIVNRDKFLVVLGGEHSITPAVVGAIAAKHRGLSVLQIDAHADLRESFMGTPHNHACAMRRTLELARATQVGIRSLSPEEAAAAPTLPTKIFYDYNMRQRADWIDRVVETLSDTVYITIDVDGFARAAAARDRAAHRRRVRHRGAVADGRERRAELPLREAGLQDPVVPIRGRGQDDARVTPARAVLTPPSSACRSPCARRRRRPTRGIPRRDD